MNIEKIVLNGERNVTLTAYIQETGGRFDYIEKRPGMLIIPGGGYQYCSEREADPPAMAFLKAGFQVFILQYSIGKDAAWPNPLNDYEAAMELIQSKEEEWKVYKDKIAVLGFSAGGHLAACGATMAEHRPAAAVLGYAVTLGDMVKNCEETAPDVVSAVDRHTCPCFVFATRDDSVVPIENSLEFVTALAKNGVSFETHIYAYGPHGFSTGDTSVQYKDSRLCSRAPRWTEDSIAWLRDVLGDFGEKTMTAPVCPKHVTGDYDDYLSLECTLGYLRHCEKAAPVMEPFLKWLEENRQQVADHIGPAAGEITRREGIEGFWLMTDKRTLREILGNTDLSLEDQESLRKGLEKIENCP